MDRATNAASRRSGDDALTGRNRRFVLTGSAAEPWRSPLTRWSPGPWTTPAFAGWCAQPTTPSSGQLGAAEAACASTRDQSRERPRTRRRGITSTSALSDVRGPYTLIVYGTSNPPLCLGPNLFLVARSRSGRFESAVRPRPKAHHHGSSRPQRRENPSSTPCQRPAGRSSNMINTSNRQRSAFLRAEGWLGSPVTGATVILQRWLECRGHG